MVVGRVGEVVLVVMVRWVAGRRRHVVGRGWARRRRDVRVRDAGSVEGGMAGMVGVVMACVIVGVAC